MEKFEIEIFRELPTETKRNIISFITNPDEIISLSSQSLEFKELLYEGVTHLKTEKDPYYLDIDWLTNYPMLQEVSDNIIFRFTLGNELNFRIPYCLKKFNFAVSYVIDDETLLINSLSYLFDQLRDDKRIYKLDECTIRVMINDATDNYDDMAFVVDNEQVCIFDQINLTGFPPLKIFNAHSIWEKLGINYPYYYMSDNNLDFLRKAYYPTPLFKQFLQDISDEIIFDFPGYYLTGYMMREIKTILCIYCVKVVKIYNIYQTLNDLTRNSLESYKIYDYLTTDYNVTETLTRKFVSQDTNTIISHLYLTQPSIFELIKQDINNLVRDHIDGLYPPIVVDS